MRSAVCIGLTLACQCSSSATNSNVPDSKPIANLALGDQRTLCDWIAQEFGGYDSRGICADAAAAGLQGPADQSSCLDSLKDYTRCSVTVGQLQVCVRWEVRNSCTLPLPPSPECAVFGPSCGRSNDAGGD
jgi:hypothetical protein